MYNYVYLFRWIPRLTGGEHARGWLSEIEYGACIISGFDVGSSVERQWHSENRIEIFIESIKRICGT